MSDVSGDDARRSRAAARRDAVSVRFVRGDVREVVSGEEALSLVMRLTRAAWSISGRAMPERRARDNMRYVFVPNCERSIP